MGSVGMVWSLRNTMMIDDIGQCLCVNVIDH